MDCLQASAWLAGAVFIAFGCARALVAALRADPPTARLQLAEWTALALSFLFVSEVVRVFRQTTPGGLFTALAALLLRQLVVWSLEAERRELRALHSSRAEAGSAPRP